MLTGLAGILEAALHLYFGQSPARRSLAFINQNENHSHKVTAAFVHVKFSIPKCPQFAVRWLQTQVSMQKRANTTILVKNISKILEKKNPL